MHELQPDEPRPSARSGPAAVLAALLVTVVLVPLAFPGGSGGADDAGTDVATGTTAGVAAAIGGIADASLVPLSPTTVAGADEDDALVPDVTAAPTSAAPSATTGSDDEVAAAALGQEADAEPAPATTNPPTTSPPTSKAPAPTTTSPPTTEAPAPTTTTTTTAPPPPPDEREPDPQPEGGTQEGKASWYELEGSEAGICAHRTLEFGTVVRVTNVANGKNITCTVGDRGPYVDGRVLDLFRDDFAKLAPTSEGVIDVRLEW